MKLRTARIVVWSMMAAAVLSGLIALVSQSPVAYVLMGLALAAELIVFFTFIRCPHCSRHLDRAGMNSEIEYCPFCGESLKDRDE
ncbi:MAG: hypothetical protein IJM83_00105 [Firmicutes bacterium]|nr:hypothetical protein [Lachnospiraceae bacterium]MBQ7057692.1 hypothetical protein [Bacillota bacterium]